MEEYFGLRYCFDKKQVHRSLDDLLQENRAGYVCVADGVTLATSHRDQQFKHILNESYLTVCDSGWVPLYLRWLYGIRREQYSGSDLMMDLIRAKKYRMMFLGSSEETLAALQQRLIGLDPSMSTMQFISLPFRAVQDFDYQQIAEEIKTDAPDVVFVSLGMPKQEYFMYHLSPYLSKGILIGVGAAFKFHSGLSNQKRAPGWMIKAKMEWVYRIFSEPRKQISRCALIARTMPGIYMKEYQRKK